MTLFDDLYLVVLQLPFEQRNFAVLHKLGGDGPAAYAGELLFGETDVLGGLHNAYLVRTSLSLNRDDVVAAVLVQPDVEFVDLDLSHALDRRAEVVLKAVRRDTQEGVDQTVVTDDRLQGLFVVQRMGPDEFRGRVRNVYGNQILPRSNSAYRPPSSVRARDTTDPVL